MITLIVLSCASEETNYKIREINGKKVFLNKNIENRNDFDIKFIKLFEVGEDSLNNENGKKLIHPFFFEVDKLNNIYVYDNNDKRVKKYDQNGNYVLGFGANGNGPGEYLGPSDLFIDRNRIHINDVRQKSLMTFDLNGVFIEKILSNKIFTFFQRMDSHSILCSSFTTEEQEGKLFLRKRIFISDDSLEIKSVLCEYLYDVNMNNHFNPLNYFHFTTIHKGKIHMAVNSVNDYRIEIYEFSGKNTQSLCKSYLRHEFGESDFFKEKSFINSLSNEEFNENFIKFRNSISGIYNLNDKYLLVSTPKGQNDPQGLKFDVFQDNVFQKSVYAEIPVESDLLPQVKIVNDRLYTIDREINRIIVYKIDY
jgi:hypothetical protein